MNPRIPGSRVCAVTLMAAGFALAIAPAAVADGNSAFNEKEFLTQTITHQFGGVRMAELCADKATRADLKGVCGKIKQTQSEEITAIRSWLKAWYGAAETPIVPPMMKPILDKLSGLSGRTLDVELSHHFAMHFREFLPRVDKCRKQAKHDELRALCQKMYETQAEEISTFEAVTAGKPITVDAGQGGLATASTNNGDARTAGWLAVGGVAAALGTAALGRRLRHR
ncbi:DUF305 domain-containing protein [Streptomyces sp. NPDC001435]|uniref:DUF305 domain-containing protein n=1 Tax=unclassified Streptomyces TaxID=2593676 RepID=UPI0036C3F30D